MSSNTISTPTGQFVEHVFQNMAYQPDDAKAAQILESDLHPDFVFTANGTSYPRASFIKQMLDARADATFKMEKNEELLAASFSQDASLETVGHMQTFLQVPKVEGKDKTRIASLTICAVKVGGDGARKLLSLTEVTTQTPA